MYQNENDPSLNPEALKDLYRKSCFEVLISTHDGNDKIIIYVPLGTLENVVRDILLNEDNEVTILGYGMSYEEH